MLTGNDLLAQGKKHKLLQTYEYTDDLDFAKIQCSTILD